MKKWTTPAPTPVTLLLIRTTVKQEEERMIGMVHIEFIEKKHLQEGWSIRQIARHLTISRVTVRKAIRMKEIPRYRLTCEKPAPVMGPLKGVIEQWLKEDEERPREPPSASPTRRKEASV
ncbi:MAG: helix-turn-helix domain-containing protein [Leptospirales bacterium]